MTPPDVKYTATATATGGRQGTVRTSDGAIDLDLRFPQDLGGPGGGANPEHLFAAGYAGCFSGSLGRAGKERGVNTGEATVVVHVGIGPHGESFGLTVTIEVQVPGQDEAEIRALTERAHELCAYSKAVRGNVPVNLQPVAD